MLSKLHQPAVVENYFDFVAGDLKNKIIILKECQVIFPCFHDFRRFFFSSQSKIIKQAPGGVLKKYNLLVGQCPFNMKHSKGLWSVCLLPVAQFPNVET